MIPFELKGVTSIATELPARAITNSGMVGSTEIFEQQCVNNKRSNTTKARRQDESTEKREARLAKMRKYNISKRQNETTEQRETRLTTLREYNISRKQNETAEQREARLAKMREYNISRKQNETAEQREARLAKKRETVSASRKRATQKQDEKKGTCSSRQIEEETPDTVSDYFPNENIDELTIVKKFHNSVSAAPLYICTCCDQLWYKHSVLPANRLRLG